MTLFTRRVSRCRILNPYHPHLANELSALADTKRCEEAVESQRQPALVLFADWVRKSRRRERQRCVIVLCSSSLSRMSW